MSNDYNRIGLLPRLQIVISPTTVELRAVLRLPIHHADGSERTKWQSHVFLTHGHFYVIRRHTNDPIYQVILFSNESVRESLPSVINHRRSKPQRNQSWTDDNEENSTKWSLIHENCKRFSLTPSFDVACVPSHILWKIMANIVFPLKLLRFYCILKAAGLIRIQQQRSAEHNRGNDVTCFDCPLNSRPDVKCDLITARTNNIV